MKTQLLTILSKEVLADQTYVIKLRMEHDVMWAAGQFVVLQIAPKVFRSYSLVDIAVDIGKGPVMTLLVDTHVGGPASQFFEQASEGTTLSLVGIPLGKLTLREGGRPKVFIATGTGLAPFIPMIKQAFASGGTETVSLFFGVRSVKDAYAGRFFEEFLVPEFSERFRLYSCISQPDGDLTKESVHLGNFVAGRVTAVVPDIVTDYHDSDFYLCGNPTMIDDMVQILVSRGGESLPGGKGNIHAERY